MGKPEELLPALLYLASDASGYTTGSNVIVDGGYTCLWAAAGKRRHKKGGSGSREPPRFSFSRPRQ